MTFINATEATSNYQQLEKMSVEQIIFHINQEDKLVPLAVEKALPAIQAAIQVIVQKMKQGGRLFYIGAGTSGRLGILDASECPPSFGVPNNLVIGIIAGGNTAVYQAVENAEDNKQQGWKDLQQHSITNKDVVVGIAASGTTMYVIEALKICNTHNITTVSICCNANAPISTVANHAIEVIVGPEFVTGSTRMKSGTAQKMVLNMISTACMIQLGKVEGNNMVHMQLTNKKLIDRGTKMLMQQLALTNADVAKALLMQYGNVKKAIEAYQQ
jgi:N-acetylmuramic acid 6-phosphate etherase